MHAKTKIEQLDKAALVLLPEDLRELTIKFARCPMSVYAVMGTFGLSKAREYAMNGWLK